MSNVLVVYFSRSGHTRSAAERVARTLHADVEEITEARDRAGILGYLRSSVEAFFHRVPPIAPPARDASSYDLVVIGTPIWNASLSSPVRAYLAQNAHRLTRYAAMLTCGGMGMERVVLQMAAVAGFGPCARVAITDSDRERGVDAAKLDLFTAELASMVPTKSRAAA